MEPPPRPRTPLPALLAFLWLDPSTFYTLYINSSLFCQPMNTISGTVQELAPGAEPGSSHVPSKSFLLMVILLPRSKGISRRQIGSGVSGSPQILYPAWSCLAWQP